MRRLSAFEASSGGRVPHCHPRLSGPAFRLDEAGQGADVELLTAGAGGSRAEQKVNEVGGVLGGESRREVVGHERLACAREFLDLAAEDRLLLSPRAAEREARGRLRDDQAR